MDSYKKIIKSQHLRKIILRLLFWVPTYIMLRIQYKIKLGVWPNFKNPVKYTEKIQVYKMNYKRELLRVIADKAKVNKYVISKGLEHLLIKNYMVCDKFEQIDFTLLPNEFVIKANNGGGGNEVIIVKDKSSLDLKRLERTIKKWPSKSRSRDGGREWCYGGIKTKIIIQEILNDNENGIVDYKFFCFNGKVTYFYVIKNRGENKFYKGEMGIYDEKNNKIEHIRENFVGYQHHDLPDNIDEMKKYAETLSSDFPHARVDLYNINGRVYFGEITFYTASGYLKYLPNNNLDYIMGNLFTEYNKKYKYNEDKIQWGNDYEI